MVLLALVAALRAHGLPVIRLELLGPAMFGVSLAADGVRIGLMLPISALSLPVLVQELAPYRLAAADQRS